MKTGNEPVIDADGPRPADGLAWDCPECGVPASVRAEVCEVCFAELDEFRLDPIEASPDLTGPLQ